MKPLLASLVVAIAVGGCSLFVPPHQGTGEGEGEGEGDVGEGEGDVGEGEGDVGEGEGDVGEGEGECVDCGDGVCADLDNDNDHCGRCDVQCDSSVGSCVAGTCKFAPACDPGLTLCAVADGDLCVDLDVSADHCGECGNACRDDGIFCNGVEVCVDGGCAHADVPCGDDGCDEASHVCGSCDAGFGCPGSAAFCDDFFACDAGRCVAHDASERCVDPAKPFCQGGVVPFDAADLGDIVGRCVGCRDKSDCDSLEDGLFCNGVFDCVDDECVELAVCVGAAGCSEVDGCF